MKKHSLIAFLLALSVLLCSCGSKDPDTKESTGAPDAPKEEKEYQKTTAIESKNFTVDSSMFCFMYFSDIANYILPKAEEYGLMYTLSLAEQPYSDTQTWEQYLYEVTKNNILNTIYVAEYARSVGHEFSEIDRYLDEQLGLWKDYAEEAGLSFEEYIKMYFGDHVTEEDIRNSFELQFYAYSYNEILANEARARLDESYYADYYEANKDNITETEPAKNVCHILFTADKYGGDEAAKAKAEEVLSLYRAGEATRESFEALGKEYTEDSNTFYENVPRGMMVKEFEDWIYDSSRKEGDTGLVLTSYGYHIMYFAGDGEIPWHEDAEEKCIQDYLSEKTNEFSSIFSDDIKISEDIVSLLPDYIPSGYISVE